MKNVNENETVKNPSPEHENGYDPSSNAQTRTERVNRQSKIVNSSDSPPGTSPNLQRTGSITIHYNLIQPITGQYNRAEQVGISTADSPMMTSRIESRGKMIAGKGNT